MPSKNECNFFTHKCNFSKMIFSFILNHEKKNSVTKREVTNKQFRNLGRTPENQFSHIHESVRHPR